VKRKETSIAFLAEITGAVFDRTLCVALIATWFPKLTLAFPNSFAGIAGLDAYLARDFACIVYRRHIIEHGYAKIPTYDEDSCR
jgi:hypothetical protein